VLPAVNSVAVESPLAAPVIAAVRVLQLSR